MAHTASGTAQQLHQIIRMNEDVKTILATAEAINLLALNASVTARRIGSLGRGFVQVASELTDFSRETRRTMNNLRVGSFQLLVAVTRTLKEDRLLRYLQKAGVMRESENSFVQERRNLLQQMDQVKRLAARGHVLANLAQIEAAQTTSLRRELLVISAEFSEAIETIRKHVESLGREARGIA